MEEEEKSKSRFSFSLAPIYWIDRQTDRQLGNWPAIRHWLPDNSSRSIPNDGVFGWLTTIKWNVLRGCSARQSEITEWNRGGGGAEGPRRSVVLFITHPHENSGLASGSRSEISPPPQLALLIHWFCFLDLCFGRWRDKNSSLQSMIK